MLMLMACGLAGPAFGQYENESYWDGVYKADHAIFVRRATALLVSAVKGRPPGKALDIGMGQGRNSIFLAQQGWEVTGFDLSREGIRQAQEQAGKLGLPLRSMVAREQDFDLGLEQWDMIVMTYVRPLRPGDADRFAHALRPQGIFVYENNNVSRQNDLLRDFLAWRILRFEDVDTNSDWHPEKTQRVERLVAEKPGIH